MPIGADKVRLDIKCLSLVRTKDKVEGVCPLRNLVGFETSCTKFESKRKSTNNEVPSLASNGFFIGQLIRGKSKSPTTTRAELLSSKDEIR